MGKKKNSIKMEKEIDKEYHILGLKYKLSDYIIKNIIKSQYEFIRKEIVNIDFHNTKTEEEFNKLKTNFILKHLGKIYTNYKLLERIQKQSETVTKYNKERWKK